MLRGWIAGGARDRRHRVPAEAQPEAAEPGLSSPPRRSPRSDVPGSHAKPAPDRERKPDAGRSSRRSPRHHAGRAGRAGGPHRGLRAPRSRSWRDGAASNAAWRNTDSFTALVLMYTPGLKDKVTSTISARN